MTEIDPHTCALDTCDRNPAPPSRLCRGHSARLGQWLADLEQLYATLDPRLTMGTDWNTSHGGGLASERAPARLDVLVLRDPRSRERDDHDTDSNTGRSVLEVLHAYAVEVREARALTTPDRVITWRESPHPGPVCAQRCAHPSCTALAPWLSLTVPAEPTVTGERALLVAHLDWCLAQDFAPAMYGEIRQVWSQLKAAHGEHPPKPAATCWVPTDDGVCGGPIWSDPGQAWCGKCRASWTGLALLRIRPVLDGAA